MEQPNWKIFLGEDEGGEVQNSNQEEEEITLKRALFNLFHYLYSLIV